MNEDYVDEDYGAGSPRSSRSSRASNSPRASDGIAGLNPNLGPVQAPTGPDLVMPARPGAGSVNFHQADRFQPQNHDVYNMQQSDDDDDLVRLLVRGDPNPNDDDVVNRLMRSQIARQVEPQVGHIHAEQVLNRIQPQSRAYSVHELTQMRQRRQDQQQLRQLRIIWQNCNRPRLLRLFASIDRANRSHDAHELRRVLQQLDHILEIPQRVINDASRSHSRAFERLFERLRCRTPEARRALRAFVSGSRNQLRGRLRAMITRRGPPQTQSQSRKGGKRQTKTKKRAFKRNKTVKRR
jgi:hypothetical protein